MIATAAREVELVPPGFVCLLEQAGLLPHLPEEVVALKQAGTRRAPTLDDVAALSWLLEWDGPKLEPGGFVRPAGVLAYRDGFDYPSGSDVREVVHVAGSRRAVINLLRYTLTESRACGRRLIGSVDSRNAPMIRVLTALSVSPTRTIWEDA